MWKVLLKLSVTLLLGIAQVKIKLFLTCLLLQAGIMDKASSAVICAQTMLCAKILHEADHLRVHFKVLGVLTRVVKVYLLLAKYSSNHILDFVCLDKAVIFSGAPP